MIDDLTLNSSKLHKPALTTDIIVQSRLVDQLQRGLAGPLTLVCAPAGYGKTTLVSAYLADASRATLPAAWLSIDEQDSELTVFVRYFCTAVRTLFPGACPHTLALLNAPHTAPPAALVTALSTELVNLPREFVLVLDDYHTISGTAVPELLSGIARHWPRTLHLVLITRRSPLLPLVTLRAKSQLTEIRTSDLQFTLPEATQYLAQKLSVPPAAPLLAELMEQTEGWIVGLHLAALALQSQPQQLQAAITTHLVAADANLAAYLIGELLTQQPPDVLAFMLKTSILNRFCVPLAEHAVAPGPGERTVQECIDHLQHTNLLFVALDRQQGWYRYHHLLQEFLRLRAADTFGPDQVRALHHRAAAWFADQGLTDEALPHAQAAGDLELAVRVMEHGLCAVLNRPDPAALRRWLDLLPAEFRRSRLSMLLMEALVLHFSYRYGELAALLEEIEPRLPQAPAAPLAGEAEILRGQFLALRAMTAYFTNQSAAGIAAAQEVLVLLPASWSYVRGLGLFWLGVNGQVSGQGAVVGRQLWSRYVALSVKNSVEAVAILNSLCTMAFLAGNLEKVKEAATLLLEQSRRGALVAMEGWAHYWLGVVHYEWNDLAAAAAHLHEVAHLRYTVNSFAARNGLLCLARLQSALGDLASAGHTLNLISQYDLDVLGYETAETAALRAQLSYQYGDGAAAVRWAVAFVQPVPDHPLPEFYNAHYVRACILLAGGTPASNDEGMRLINKLAGIAERSFHTRLQIELLAVQALVLQDQGSEQAAQTAITSALALAEPGGFIRTFLDLGPRMEALLARTAGADAAYVLRILAAFPAAGQGGAPASAPQPDPAPRDLGHLDRAPVEPLTARELEILALIGARLSDKEIAHTLSIATSTVHRHIANVYGKLGVNRRWDAVVKAQALGLLPR